jgi:uncharacterized protein (DUF2147 family)
MKHLGILFSLLIVLCCMVAKSQETNVVGTWWNDDQTSHIRIFKATNGNFYGKIEYLKNEPERLDKNNPDVEKQKEPMLGLMILKGFSYDSAKKQWTGGTIYDPDNGKTYDCYMWFEEGTDLLYIKGYVLGMKFVGRETQWTRVKE